MGIVSMRVALVGAAVALTASAALAFVAGDFSGSKALLSHQHGDAQAASRARAADRLPPWLAALDGKTSPNLPADCIPANSGPPTAPYQLGIVGSVTNGTLKAGPASIADIKAKFCGVVTVVKGQPPCGATGTAVSPPDGQVFGSLQATLTLIPGMTPKVPFTAHPGTITGGFACGSSADGLVVNLVATVSGSTGLFGLSCTIGPITIALRGALTGPLDDASITLSSDKFAVPAVAPSTTCPGQVPQSLDKIAGLPIAPGGASINLPATVSLYRPA
jgi:hypothetical protein